MREITRWMASAAVGGLGILWISAFAWGQAPQVHAVGRVASVASGAIHGIVHDETGLPVVGAMVSALGASTAFAVTDRTGRFELRTLSPGPYLVRAHLSGFLASRGQIVEVRPSSRASSSIALYRVAAAPSSSIPVVPASIGAPTTTSDPAAPPKPESAVGTSGADTTTNGGAGGDTAWRLRHTRRGVLKDESIPDLLLTDAPAPDGQMFGPQGLFSRAVGSPARAATAFFTDTAFSGQFNLLTTSSFNTPQQLFTATSFARSVAYLSVGAPVAHADWTVRGALTQGDISSWVVAGEYTTRAPARHRYDVGLSYSTQRYDGGNPAALRNVRDGSRNAGTLYGYDTFALAPALSLTYGGRYARYDYLDGQSLISPRVALTLVPSSHFRVNTLVAQRALAPGAEEFLPPADTGVWLPPQRTFSPLVEGRRLAAERATHYEAEVERDIAAGTTLSARAFRQTVSNQLVTMFGVEVPGHPRTALGHYLVASNGGVEADGWSAGLRAAFSDRVHGSVEYSQAYAHWNPTNDLAYLILFAPSALRLTSERIHDVATSFETDLPETSTRVIVLYRVSNGFARGDAGDRPGLDYRFDVQVRQSLPFMDFSTAKWEMLVAVRNFFREVSADQSIYDELLVVHPPKRVVGGLTLRF